jgi:hypothetical protein
LLFVDRTLWEGGGGWGGLNFKHLTPENEKISVDSSRGLRKIQKEKIIGFSI